MSTTVFSATAPLHIVGVRAPEVIPAFEVHERKITLNDIPGLGIVPNLAAIEPYRIQ